MVAGLPVWSSDGEWIYFAAVSVADNDLWRRRADLSGPPERLLAANDFQGPSSISGDGEWLYYTNSVAAPPDIMRLNLRQAGDPEPVVATPAAEFDGRVSPDGRFVAFMALEGDSTGLYVQEIVVGSRRLIASETSAVRGSGEYWGHTWSAATGELLFTRSGGLWAVGYTAEPDFVPQVPELLRPHPDGVIATRPALTTDGQRVVHLRELRDPDETEAAPVRIEVVLNGFAELQEKVPTER